MAPHESTRIESIRPITMESILFGDELNTDSLKTKIEDYDFYRYLVSDFHGIARCKIITKSAYPRMSKKGPGIAWRTPVLSFDSFNNYDLTRVDGKRCTDARLIVEQSVPRPLQWAGKGHSVAGVICETWWGVDEQPQMACPRYMARRLCEKLESEFKLRILHASEMEFTIFKENMEPLFEEGGFYISQEFANHEEELLSLSTMCEKAGIPIETLQTEYGPGQIELVLKPEFGVEGADNEFLFKNAAKEMLQKPGQYSRCTFMSKPIIDKVGNGSHYNHSLWKVKENGDVEDAMWDGSEDCKLTKTAQHWLAGIMKHSPALAAICNPTVNCWRRLHVVSGEHDIGTPDNITWGLESRDTMIRVIARGAGKATYLENRSPGAAMNPYLGLAGMVAAGLDGIRNELELPAEGTGLNECGKLTGSLEDALQALENDGAMVDLLGQEFVNWFTGAKRNEMVCLQKYTEKHDGDSFKAKLEYYSRWI
ncbi:glutamine synthetase-like [Clytia hemisphaerica]|uniref:Lengsin n=1 Tax=Clytia hemisphaerica TaxID=252671 RepID=A0A7M5XJV0_9CNID